MPVSSQPALRLLRRATPFVLLAGWCVVIFAFSAQPDLTISDDDLLDLVLRKSAHVVVFAVLALLAWHAARALGLRGIAALGAAWLFALAYAVSDEWHQSFVHGRVGQPRDVLIDMVGATAALAWLAWRHRRETR